MCYKDLLLLIFYPLLAVSCATDSNSTESKFQSDGISNSEVNTLKARIIYFTPVQIKDFIKRVLKETIGNLSAYKTRMFVIL